MLYFHIILLSLVAVNGKSRIKKKSHIPEPIDPNSENGFYFRKIPHLQWCKKLHWQHPPAKLVPALATAPGSGSIWLRYLLQHATGIATGSTNRDLLLLTHGFPGENVTSGSVLIVKTHLPPQKTNSWCSAAVLLYRNLADSVLAEFNRLNAGFKNTAPISAFKNGAHANPSHDWSQFALHRIVEWEELYTAWLKDFDKPMIVVRYEQLVRDSRTTLGTILKFLGQKITDKEMTCVMANREGVFRRYHKIAEFDPFTAKMRRMMKKAQTRVFALIKEYENTHNYTSKFEKLEKAEDDGDTTLKTVNQDGKSYRVLINDWKGVMIS